MPTKDNPLVLVVDDERDLADLYTTWLSTEHTVKTAYSGQDALDALDRTIDVILLDRRMPELSGDEVLEEIRERGLESRVAMVTAVAPDFDILELGFDDYLVKPVTRADVLDVVKKLLARKQHDTAVQRYYQLVSKKTALEAEMGAEVMGHPKYETLCTEIASIAEQIDDLGAEFDIADYEAQLYKIGLDTEAADADLEEDDQ